MAWSSMFGIETTILLFCVKFKIVLSNSEILHIALPKSDIISSMEQKVKFLSDSFTAAASALRAAQALGLLFEPATA